MTFFRYAIGVGHNVALGSLLNLETIRPTGDRYFYAPQVLPNHTPGQGEIRGDGLLYLRGSISQRWRFGAMTRAQYFYLKTTYCVGGYSGNVTIYTRLGAETYTRCNAVMILPFESAIDWRGKAAARVEIEMTRLEAL